LQVVVVLPPLLTVRVYFGGFKAPRQVAVGDRDDGGLAEVLVLDQPARSPAEPDEATSTRSLAPRTVEGAT